MTKATERVRYYIEQTQGGSYFKSSELKTIFLKSLFSKKRYKYQIQIGFACRLFTVTLCYCVGRNPLKSVLLSSLMLCTCLVLVLTWVYFNIYGFIIDTIIRTIILWLRTNALKVEQRQSHTVRIATQLYKRYSVTKQVFIYYHIEPIRPRPWSSCLSNGSLFHNCTRSEREKKLLNYMRTYLVLFVA